MQRCPCCRRCREFGDQRVSGTPGLSTVERDIKVPMHIITCCYCYFNGHNRKLLFEPVRRWLSLREDAQRNPAAGVAVASGASHRDPTFLFCVFGDVAWRMAAIFNVTCRALARHASPCNLCRTPRKACMWSVVPSLVSMNMVGQPILSSA